MPNGTGIFRNFQISRKKDNLERWTKIFETNFWKLSVPLDFEPEFPEIQLVEWNASRSSICCKCIGNDVIIIIIGITQQQKLKFSLPWGILTERCNSPSQNIPFFQNADSRFFVNTIIFSNFLTLFTSCKHRHRYYVGILQIFEQLRLFFQRVWNLKMLRPSLEFRMISLMANFRSKQFICRSLLLG